MVTGLTPSKQVNECILYVFRSAHDSDALNENKPTLILLVVVFMKIVREEGGGLCAGQRHNVSSVLRLSVQSCLAWKAVCVCELVSVFNKKERDSGKGCE